MYRRLIGEKVDGTTRVLDIGCGRHAGYLKDVYDRTPFSYGVDLDADALAKNTTIRNTVVANADDLPFQDEFFDIVTLAWVLEHLESPEQVFRGISRVLKPHGTVFFLTPNTWNYNVSLIRALPNASHQYLARRLYQRPEHDAFPTRYEINAPARVERLLTKVGFERERLILDGDPTYISSGSIDCLPPGARPGYRLCQEGQGPYHRGVPKRGGITGLNSARTGTACGIVPPSGPIRATQGVAGVPLEEPQSRSRATAIRGSWRHFSCSVS